MRIPSPASRRKARIEIIPLIDIIFFLLATFVMLSLSMVKNQGLRVALPTAATRDPAGAPDAIVTVDASGKVFFGPEPVTRAQLAERVREVRARIPDPLVYLNGDERSSFGRSIAVVDLLRLEGVARVSIRTSRK